jgi:rhodanese-related sulfurtransferase
MATLLASWTMASAEEAKKKDDEPFKRLTVDEVEKRLAEPRLHVIDGNSDQVYREGHLPGAIHLLSKDIKEGVLPTDKNTPLVFYCHSER